MQEYTIFANETIFQGGDGDEGFFITELTGWNKGPNVKRNDQAIPMGDGDFEIPGFLDSRIVSWHGKCLTRHGAGRMEDYGEELSGLFGGGGLTEVSFAGPRFKDWGFAQLASGAPEFDIEMYGEMNSYQVTLKFPKPYKYSEGEKNYWLAGEDAFHRGNYNSIPTQIIEGYSTGGYDILGPNGRRVRVDFPLRGGGEQHVIDFRNMDLYVGGQLVEGRMPISQPWSIPGYATKVRQDIVGIGGDAYLKSEVLRTSI